MSRSCHRICNPTTKLPAGLCLLSCFSRSWIRSVANWTSGQPLTSYNLQLTKAAIYDSKKLQIGLSRSCHRICNPTTKLPAGLCLFSCFSRSWTLSVDNWKTRQPPYILNPYSPTPIPLLVFLLLQKLDSICQQLDNWTTTYFLQFTTYQGRHL
ncbi:hypothetical protein CLV31_10124 [Algoriphagus aquaeductus]|uniref:Uncharacterized protein n=1 Tax=Algoriphagus aquaeductus TaxID=475299 RepID=A0A326S6F8_9BACT|nr:hypothetical protein CLV31_10124 [Algoriphagus aquaeductus]